MLNPSVRDDSECLISFVTPLFNPPLTPLLECVERLVEQMCQEVEWVLVDDGSDDLDFLEKLRKALDGSRYQLELLRKNVGIGRATNHGIRNARGRYIAFLDQDDLLSPDAVSVVREYLKRDSSIDILYSDENKISNDGIFYDDFKKPDWSPERLRHQNYISHLSVIRKSLIEEAGYLSETLDGAQDHDLLLKCSELSKVVTHIPRVLYHWRAVETSTAFDPDSKRYASDAAVRSVQDHLDRVGIPGIATRMGNTYVNIDRALDDSGFTSIVIPTRGTISRLAGYELNLVENCLESIFQKSNHANIEVVVVIDSQGLGELEPVISRYSGDALKVVEYSKDFNFSEKVNLGFVHTVGDVVIALNDDTQIITDDWVRKLRVYFNEPDVAVVGPKLLFPDGLIQSAGHFYSDGPQHVAAGVKSEAQGPFGILSFPSERSGLTFACVAIRRTVYDQVGGLDEGFPRAFNDVDFGEKCSAMGYRMIWTPEVSLYHFESLSRDPAVEPFEVNRLYQRWSSIMDGPDRFLPNYWNQHYGISSSW